MKEEIQRQLAKNTPFFPYIGIQIVELREGFARLKVDFRECLTHPLGYFHGGVLAALADSAGVNAVLTTVPDNQGALTIEMKINYLAASRDPVLFAEGQVIHRGKRTAVADVDVMNGEGLRVAKALITCVLNVPLRREPGPESGQGARPAGRMTGKGP